MKYLLVFIVLACWAYTAQAREDKFLSMFNIVKFPNDPCDSGGTKNGTCYTKEECDNKGGTEDGSCASGYGVCCTFTIECGDHITENNTYFESNGDEKGHCNVKICKANPSIVQLRLDFVTFQINGPSTTTTSTLTGTACGGHIVGETGGKSKSSFAGRCLTDVFSVTNAGGMSPPSICGDNSDEHMYVDFSSDCIDLNMILGDGSSIRPTWSIQVMQYEKDFVNLAPEGCTQWFYDKEDADGVLRSYNWANKVHLADQKQVICIRREEDKSKICYTAVTAISDISISGKKADDKVIKKYSCGGYTKEGSGKFADALIIPSLIDPTGTTPAGYSNYCGQSGFANSPTADNAGPLTGTGKTVCTKRLPFTVTFISDSLETVDEWDGTAVNQGFQIAYVQT